MDPITIALASAVVTGAATSASDSAGTALATLVGRVRDRFRDTPTVLESEERTAGAIEEEFARDPGFRRECHALWAQVQGDGVSNSLTGRAKNVVQARDVHGPVTLN